MEITERVQLIANAIDDKKGTDIKILDVAELTSLSEYFVIASGTSAVQVRACAESVEEKMDKAGYSILHREGRDSGSWLLLDYGDIVVHIMMEETREFYDIERLWSDAKSVEVKQ